MIHVSVTGDAEVAAAFKRVGSRVRERIRKAIVDQAEDLRQYIITQELSGQMLKVRTGKRRVQMTFQTQEKEGAIVADIHPQGGSVLWALGKGMRARDIRVRRRSTRVERRAARARGGRQWKRALRRQVGTYSRSHHLNKVPFMEAAFASHRAQIRGAIEAAVAAATDESQAADFEVSGGEGI